jgi:hypothetical protein
VHGVDVDEHEVADEDERRRHHCLDRVAVAAVDDREDLGVRMRRGTAGRGGAVGVPRTSRGS